VLFYTLTLYKEAAIQAYTVWIFLFIYIFAREDKWWALAPALLLTGFLAFERIYLPWMFVTTYLIVLFANRGRYRYAAIAIAVLGFVLAFMYTPWLKDSPLLLIEKLKELRQSQMGYTDYSFKYNYEIPYPLAVLKTLFTPFITPGKFTLFSDFSYLLIWGSFVNQAVMVAFAYQWWREAKAKSVFHFSLLVPFLICTLLLAYIAPWAGRIRDSFFPLIALYVGCFAASGTLERVAKFFLSRPKLPIDRSILELEPRVRKHS
jgi:hypothetical protein